MAHMILIEISDDVQVQAFMEEVSDQDEVVIATSSAKTPMRARVRGLYRIPTKFCEDPPEVRSEANKNPNRGTNMETSARGEKYGWWIKRCCGKPLKGMMQMPHNLIEKAQGKTGWQQDYRIIIPGGGLPRRDG